MNSSKLIILLVLASTIFTRFTDYQNSGTIDNTSYNLNTNDIDKNKKYIDSLDVILNSGDDIKRMDPKEKNALSLQKMLTDIQKGQLDLTQPISKQNEVANNFLNTKKDEPQKKVDDVRSK